MFVSAGSEIHRFSPNGDIEVVHRGVHGPVTQLAVGPGDDLYFLQPDTAQVRVLVKVADAPAVSGGASSGVSAGTVALVLVGGGIVLARVRANRWSAPQVAESSGAPARGMLHCGLQLPPPALPPSAPVPPSAGLGGHQIFALCPQWSQVGPPRTRRAGAPTPDDSTCSNSDPQRAWSCCSSSRVSALSQYSASLPRSMRSVSVPVKVITVPGLALAPGKLPA